MRYPQHYRWSPATGQYIDASGRFVSRAKVRASLDTALANAQREITTLGQQLRRREIPLQEWELRMRRATKDVHLYSATAAKGGFGQMTQADYGRVGRTMREQYKYLSRFAKQIEAGLPLDGRFLRRVELYAQSGRASYEALRLETMRQAGYTQQRSVLNPADHCDSCVIEAAKGWGSLGHVKQVGTRDCLSRCRCHVEFRKAG